MVKIAIDIGHGGRDPGAVHFTADGQMISESQILNEIAPAAIVLLAQQLNDENVTFISTQGDESMTIGDRAKQIASLLMKDFDLVLSLHMNIASDVTATGAECYFLGEYPSAEVLAKNLINRFTKETGLRNRGAKPDTMTAVGGLGIMRKPEVFGTGKQDRVLLLECGFISNDEDVAIVRSKAPRAIAIAALACLGLDLTILVDPDPIFPDVPYNHYGYNAILRMANKGILQGYGDGLFRPDQPMTRAEVAIVADRLCTHTEEGATNAK